MSRTMIPALALAAVMSLAARHTTLVKNPVEIRVTSVDGDSIEFTAESRGGYLALYTTDGKVVQSPKRATTPAEFRGFPSGVGLLFQAPAGRRLHVEAWRFYGDTTRVAADGNAIVVRAPLPTSRPDVTPAPQTARAK